MNPAARPPRGMLQEAGHLDGPVRAGALDRVDVHVHPTRYSPHGPAFAERNRLEYSPQGLLREMDRSGIRWGVFLAPRRAPSPEEGLAEGAQVSQESQGRLLLTATEDPTRPAEEIHRTLDLWDRSPDPVRAIKLYPGYQPFAIDDPRVEPILGWAERHRAPVFVHQGDTSDPNGLVKFARPLFLDDVAVRWRSVDFVLCHLGNPWMEEAAEVIYKNPNVWGDTSGLLNPFSPRYDLQVRRMVERLRYAVYAVGDPGKLLYRIGLADLLVAGRRGARDVARARARRAGDRS